MRMPLTVGGVMDIEAKLLSMAEASDEHYEALRKAVNDGDARGRAAALLEGAMEALENAAANMRAARKLMIEARGGIDRAGRT